MYFSSLVKQELARIMPIGLSEQRGEFLAFVMMKGFINKTGETLSVILDNPIMIKIVYSLFKKFVHKTVFVETIKKGNKKKFYLITVSDPEKIKNILQQYGLKINQQGKLTAKMYLIGKNENFYRNISQRTFLRGAFLAEGFVNDPERMYHLEISSSSKVEAEMIYTILQQNSFSAKLSFWQKRWAVYIKKSEQIFDFLRYIGVQRALLDFQDIIARKDILNKVNRLVNCETANLDKTILSSSRQMLCIDIVKNNIGLENLSPGLAEVAKARLEHPYASIRELATIIGGSISKSGIFHRLRKIEELADYRLPQEDCVAGIQYNKNGKI